MPFLLSIHKMMLDAHELKLSAAGKIWVLALLLKYRFEGKNQPVLVVQIANWIRHRGQSQGTQLSERLIGQPN